MSRRFSTPYAKALVDAAGTTERAVTVRAELERFVEAARSFPEIKRMASNPGVPRRVKEDVLRQLCERLEIGPLTRSLLDLLMKNYRLTQVDAVLDAVDRILDRRLGVVRAQVRTAHALTGDQESRLRAVLERMLEKKVKLELDLEPRLLAGFVARIGSRRYDASLNGQIDRLAATLAGSERNAG
jgi:F-type H+-transporting ATPase subunit delta